jgi:hypothetical protein
MADTMLLDIETWDLVLTDGGNWALAASLYPGDPAKAVAYGQAQDAASQLRLFSGELNYDTTQGVPYWEQILGFAPSTQLIAAKWEEQALLVPGVILAVCAIPSVNNRAISVPNPASVTITNDEGQVETLALTAGRLA